MKCLNCYYFREERCHRFPPVPTQYGDAIYPKVNGDGVGCGEFKSGLPASTTIPENMINSVTTIKPKKEKKKNA